MEPLFGEAVDREALVTEALGATATPPRSPRRRATPPPTPAESAPPPTETAEPPPQRPALCCAHPETGEELYLPDGYSLEPTGGLQHTKANFETVPVYPARLYVRATGRNLADGSRTLEVTFVGQGGEQTVQAPRAELATSAGVIRHLAGRGAYVTSGNASRVVAYLSAFEACNAAALPERRVSDRLGVLPGGALVTPGGSVGDEVTYVGPALGRGAPGGDGQAYVDALREVASWEGATPLWWLLGLSLASPALQRARPRRYPVTYLAGDSGSGKTTAAFFALGAWARPGEEPFSSQGLRTTQAAFTRFLERLGGLPYLIDEAHACERPRDLEHTVYTFANGQSYARVGRSAVEGGTPLGGAVLLVGEARPEFEHAGSHNRLLLVSADTHPPLGREAGRGTPLGAERAARLEAAWEAGAGHLGPAVARVLWGDWRGFETRVAARRARPELRALQAWSHAAAIVLETLEALFSGVLERPVPGDVRALPGQLLSWLERHHEAAHPADEAFERLRTLFVQGRVQPSAHGPTLSVGGEFVGWQQRGCWYLLSGSRAVQSRVGAQGVQLHGRRWAEQGRLRPDARQGSTQAVYCPVKRVTVRALVVPCGALEGEPEEGLPRP